MVERLHPLALLHQRGAPAGVRRVGRCPHAGAVEVLGDGEQADVVVVGTEAGESGVRGAVAGMAEDGLLLVDARRRAQRALGRVAEQLGLVAAGPPLVWRKGTFATLDRPTLAFAVGLSGRAGGRVARLASTLPTAALSRLVPSLTAFGRGTPTLAGWLGSPAGGLVIASSWRGQHGSAVVTRVVDGRPSVVGKVALGSDADAGLRELRALTRLGPVASSAGLTVPTPLGRAIVGGRPAAILSALAGAPVATRPAAARSAATAVAEWLVGFTQRTLVEEPAGATLASLVLGPLDALEGDIEPAYTAHVRRLVSVSGDNPLPLAASHGDLTLWNVIDGTDGLGIVDWEQARERSLPIVDLPYLLVDAIRLEQGLPRPSAYSACFDSGGVSSDWASVTIERVRQRVGLPAEVVELALHACWLGHAADERRRGSTTTPFLAVLQRHSARFS